jgi:RecB family exonuclease
VRRVNQSELTTFMRCPRKWNLSYIQGFEPEEKSSALTVGSLVHAGLEAHYRGGDALSVIPELEEGEDHDPDTLLSAIMLEGYLEWLEETGIDAGDLTPIWVENQMEIPLGVIGGQEVVLHGTVDWTARDPFGQLWLFDHKTVAAFGALVDRRLQLSFQLLTYAWMLRESTGEAPAGVVLNMLRKVKRTASAKPPFYAREAVQFNAAQLDNHGKNLYRVIERMLQAEADGDNYPVPDSDCTWKCPFLQVCPLMDDGSDIMGALNELYVRRTR